MANRAHLLGALLSLTAALAAQQGRATRSAHCIAAGTKWQTSAVVIDSGVAGPTALVVGGVHGNEPAGYRAARQASGWRVAKGRLVVIPRANELGLRAGTRRMPGLSKERGDLNRQFPTAARPSPVGELATALWDFVTELSPDFVVDLHEGYDFTQRNPKSVGSSLIGAEHPGTAALAKAAQAAVNAEIAADDLKFVLKKRAVNGSLIRAVVEQLQVPALILETTTKSQAYAVRARQHRLMVHALLAHLGMVTDGPHVLLGDARREGALKVGMFSAKGVSGNGPKSLERLLRDGFDVRRFGARDVQDGALDQFDVVVFPGGSGSGQARALGSAGRERVRKFVRRGGGYVGICAGAYLAANNYEWSLDILDADVIDRKHWARGRGTVQLAWSKGARAVVGAPTTDAVRYANGPIYARSGDDELEDFVVLATYRSEVNTNGAPEGVMLDAPAIVRGVFGAGRVVCSSPHPEQTEGLEEVVRRLVHAAAQRGSR
ncbi:MAG: BPL-N domain-containing protein [Planctomycetota bacterium]|nr:BPL-N domain-containing protein [Planctomycetota bacterium]